MFSIIIPHYNTPVCLMRLLASIDKTDSWIQVIVVDDRSTIELEKFSECQQAYQEKGVEFYRNEGKKGAGTCRNIGLKHAVGKWILFADADDVFLPGYKEIIGQYLNSKSDIIFFIPTSKEEDTGKISTRHLTIEKYIYKYHYSMKGKKEGVELKYHHVVPWSKLIRHSAIRNGNINFEEVLYSNDVMFSTKLAYYCNAIETSLSPIYCCMRNRNSLTSNISADSYQIRRSVWIRRYLFLREHLSKEEFAFVNLSGANYILMGIQQKVGVCVLLETVKLFLKYHIKLMPAHFMSKEFLWEHVFPNLREWMEAKKYYKRNKPKNL